MGQPETTSFTAPAAGIEELRMNSAQSSSDDNYDIAIIGMDGRFPGARSPEEFWRNLKNGVETISFFSDDELEISPDSPILKNPAFVKAGGVLENIDLFDASFFNIPAPEAEWMDPQQRLFLECAWSAIENAGYNLQTYKGLMAVYAGVNTNYYLLTRLAQLSDANTPNLFQLMLANEKDFLATRVSYKLNLQGESVTVQTSCSTSLVAVHMACQSLLSGQCDMALAGGVSVRVPQKTGYMYTEGMISSPDGHCRAFDSRAQGTLPGSGLGVVVLKLLGDALADGDNIHAVIKGSAINNDGRHKIGYTAPSIEGQTKVIARAQAMANVKADTITFVEAHGTGTALGDPIEVEALTRAFRQQTDKKGFCALGAVKSNVGHLDTAAGMAGLFKMVLALKNKMIPPTVHFEKPNPAIDFANSPFHINNTLQEWNAGLTPRRGAVSSFGIGGTNVHMILEESPGNSSEHTSRPNQILTLSAKTPTALEAMIRNVANHLEEFPDLNLADVAYTLSVGRQAYRHKHFVITGNKKQAITALQSSRLSTSTAVPEPDHAPAIVFMFAGQGAQHINMAKELYETEPLFRRHVDSCVELAKGKLQKDLLSLLYPRQEQAEEATRLLAQPEFALPALFTIEYALAKLWISWGVHPRAMIGHSYGEYAAACLAGVFSLEQALGLVIGRGRLMQTLSPGAMTAVALSETEIRKFLAGRLSIASINSEKSSVVSGPADEIVKLEQSLDGNRIGYRRLEVPYAYHSELVEPIVAELSALIAGIPRQPPAIPFISNLTGTWIRPEEATDPGYWAKQMRQPVRFAAGLDVLDHDLHPIFIELGPNQTLTKAAKQHLGNSSLVVPSLGRSQSRAADSSVLLQTLGQLWSAGVKIDWSEFYSHERRRRVALPAYPFERQRYWIETRTPVAAESNGHSRIVSVDETVSIEHSPAPAKSNGRHPIQRAGLLQEFVPPRNAVENTLVEIWSDVLKLEGIGIEDNFFDLNGDSLIATQILARVKAAFSENLSLRDVLSHLTIAEFSQIVETRIQEIPKESDETLIRSVPRDIELPLSFSQERLWLIDHLISGSPMYNLTTAVRLAGALNVPALEQSFSEVIRRHEILRTTFGQVDGRPIQVIGAAESLHLRLQDFSDFPESTREPEALRAVAEEPQKPFDLTNGPLIRISLLRLAPDDHMLVIVLHHIVSDAWSSGLLIREVAVLYNAFCQGSSSPLSELPIQYADFAYWQRSQEESMRDQLSYWKRQLKGAPPVLNLPSARPRPQRQTFRGARQSFTWTADLTASLKALSRHENVTLFMILVAAFKTLCYRLTEQTDILIGVPIAGRSRAETEELIGCFINTLVLRTDLSGNPSFIDLLHQVRETTLGAYMHQELPFELLVEALHLERNVSYMPLVQVLFDFINVPPADIPVLPGLSVRPLEGSLQTAKQDLIVDIYEVDERLCGSVEYNTDLFEASAITSLLSSYETLLGNIVDQPNTRLLDLSLLTTEQIQQQLAEEIQLKQIERERFIHITPKTVVLGGAINQT
jgi:acyl transferase domain-containing protein/NRPS condensation-like uncharacterized protein